MNNILAKPPWRDLLRQNRPLVLPGAHDAFSARLIEMAGFPAYFIGGFQLSGARYALPDMGLVSLGEMSQGIRETMLGSGLPVLVDADDGYGDVKNVTRTIRTYEAMGASAIFIEDQVAPKRCGHMAGKAVVPVEVMEAKIRAAAAARQNKDFFLLARTDARAVEGLDAALRRGERYLRAGADGLFVESPETVAELESIGRAFDVPQLCNMLEGGRTPILSCQELHQMGFSMILHGITLLMRAARTMAETLADLKQDRLDPTKAGVTFEEYKSIVRYSTWAEIEDRFG